MFVYLPWVALVLSVALFFLESRRSSEKKSRTADNVALALSGLFVIGSWYALGQLDHRKLAIDFSIIAFALAIGFAAASTISPTVAMIGLASFALGFNQWFGEGSPGQAAAWLAALGGLAMILSKARGWSSATAFGVAAFAGGMANALGSFGPGGHAALTGSVFCLAALVGGAAMLATRQIRKDGTPLVAHVIGLVVFAGALAVVGRMFLAMQDTITLSLLGIVAAIVVAWNSSDAEPNSPVKIGIGALIWLGLATFAFSLRAGYGMSIVALSGALTLLLLNRERCIASMSPLLALTAYRVFREIFPDASRAFDIGQHYAMVGLILGVVLILAAIDFGRAHLTSGTMRSAIAQLCVGILVVILAVFSIVFLGSKGVVGLLVGLGIAPMLSALTGRSGVPALGIGAMLTGLVTLAHGPLVEYLDMERGSKQTLFIVVVVVSLIFAATAWLSVRPTNNSRHESA